MNLDRYELQSGEELEVFEFVSEGPKGRIPKIVQYFPTNYKDVYHLGLVIKILLQAQLMTRWCQIITTAKKY